MLNDLILGVERIGLANILVILGGVFLLAMTVRFWWQASRTQKALVDLLSSQVYDLTQRVRHLEDCRMTGEQRRADRLVGVLERLARLWATRACLAGAPLPTEETDRIPRPEGHA